MYLRLFASNRPEEWSKYLPMAEFTHNSATHSVTQRTPFSLMMGYKPQAYPPLGKTFLPNLENRLSNLSAARDDAQAAHCYGRGTPYSIFSFLSCRLYYAQPLLIQRLHSHSFPGLSRRSRHSNLDLRSCFLSWRTILLMILLFIVSSFS